MYIVVITGSPQPQGPAMLLAENFMAGAARNGHEIFRFDAAQETIYPCLGCGRCHRDGPCDQGDAIEFKLMPELIRADLIVLATPVQYAGMSGQLKIAIDRFYARSKQVSGKQAVLLAASDQPGETVMRSLGLHYDALLKYLKWDDRGRVLSDASIEDEPAIWQTYLAEAYRLGKSISA